MFDQPEPARPSLAAPMKLMAISVAGVLLSFGICGMAAVTPPGPLAASSPGQAPSCLCWASSGW